MPAIDLDTLVLERGGHSGPEAGMSLLEAVAFIEGEPFSDHPACVSPVLGVFGRRLNDDLPDDKRQQLKELIPLLPGTAGDGHDLKRAYLAADWGARTCLPTALDIAGLTDHAATCRALIPITSRSTAELARDTIRRIRPDAAAAAAAYAAYAAAYAAAAAAYAVDDGAETLRAEIWDSALTLFKTMIKPGESCS